MSELKKVLAEIAKKYWEGSAMFYPDFDNVEVARMPTGLPSLDIALWGWIPEWRIIEIYGLPSSGKTSCAMKFLAETQKNYPDKKVAYIDLEQAVDPKYATALGLDMENVIFSQPNSAEAALGIMEALCESWEVKAIVLDSVAKLTPKKELEGEIWDSEMAMRARLMSQALRKITPKANQHKCTCFFINQVRTSMSPYGNPEVRPGGQALPFDASVIIRTSSKKIDEKTAITTFDIKKNKVGIPFRKTEIPIIFGKGYDSEHDAVQAWLVTGVISKAGRTFTYKNIKAVGEDNFIAEVLKDKKLMEELKKDIIKNKDVKVAKEETIEEI